MPLVSAGERLDALRRLGVSGPLVRLSAGESLHPEFRDRMLGPPHLVYEGAGVPAGPPLVPLWDRGDVVVGVWARDDGVEFVEYSIEADDEYWTLARTEQGFWAAQFDLLWEFEVSGDDLRRAAEVVGFRFAEQLLAARAAALGTLGTFESHRAWLAAFVAGVDRRA